MLFRKRTPIRLTILNEGQNNDDVEQNSIELYVIYYSYFIFHCTFVQF